MPDPMTAEQVGRMKACFPIAVAEPPLTDVLALCDSHELLRARVAETEASLRATAAGLAESASSVVVMRPKLADALRRVDELSAQLAAAEQRVKDAEQHVEQMLDAGKPPYWRRDEQAKLRAATEDAQRLAEALALWGMDHAGKCRECGAEWGKIHREPCSIGDALAAHRARTEASK